MKANPVRHYTLIIRSQVEYSIPTQAMNLRYMMATPTNGQHRGFADIDDLLAAVRAELLEMQNQIIPPDQETGKL